MKPTDKAMWLTGNQHQQIKILAAQQGTTMRGVIRNLIKKHESKYPEEDILLSFEQIIKKYTDGTFPKGKIYLELTKIKLLIDDEIMKIEEDM